MNCPQCHGANPDTARFCLHCGNPFPAPRQIEGERRLVTVLFVDVVGSTAMGERLDPEQVTEIMNGAFAIFNAAVVRYGGTVSRLMGDAVLALFGAPVAHEDDAERAVRAALEIRSSARAYGDRIQRDYGVDFDVRIGLNSGLAVLAFVGDQLKTEYTAMGDTTNLAARLQSAADPGSVFISADTYNLVRGLFEVVPRGLIEFKGKSAPVEVYEVVAAKPVRSKPRGLEGVRSVIVGRDRELELLHQQIEALQHGRGAFVVVTAEAGLGKSRLVAEARETAAREVPEIRWLEGRAVSYGQGMAYYPWTQVLSESIGAHIDDSPDDLRKKLASACDRLNIPHHHRRFLETILDVVGPESAEALRSLRGTDILRGIRESLSAYLIELGRISRLVLVFDDMHWSDDQSIDLLLSIAPMVQSSPMLIFYVLRPDKNTQGGAAVARARDQLGAAFVELVLEPLSGDQARQLIGNLLQVRDLPEHVCTAILQKSEGNPFFLEEVIRALIDSQYIVRENGHWRASARIHEVTIPETLAGVLGARIDRLPADAKQVLQAASVVGRIFTQRVIEEMYTLAPAEERVPELEPVLMELVIEELIRERAHDPELEFIFKHALTQDAAYNLLLLKKRKEFHGRAARALERLYPDRLDDLSPALERHCWLAEQWEACADYAMRAGHRSSRLYALTAAVEHFDRACAALEKVPEAPWEKRFDAVLAWSQVAVKLAPADVVIERLQAAEELARAADDKRRLAQALVWKANVHFLSGFRTRGFTALTEGYRLAQEIGDEELGILPLFMMTSMILDNDPAASIEPFDEVIALAHKHRLWEVEAHALATKAMAYARLGDFDRAREIADQAIAVGRSIDSPVIEADVEMSVAQVYLDIGDIEQAIAYGKAGTLRALDARGMECACHGLYLQGIMQLQQQNLTEALEVLEKSMSYGVTFSGAEDLMNRIKTTLDFARLLTGHLEALPDVEKGLENARVMGDEFGVAYFAQGLGSFYLDRGELDKAEAYLKSALDYYRRRGMRPYVARALQGLAGVYAAQQRHEEAEAARAESQQLAQELGLVDLISPVASS